MPLAVFSTLSVQKLNKKSPFYFFEFFINAGEEQPEIQLTFNANFIQH